MAKASFNSTVVFLLALGACSASRAPDQEDVGDSGTGSGSGGAAASVASSTGDGDLTGPGSTTTTGSGGEGGACAATSIAATPVPVTMFVMFDRSGSMDKSNKWINATAAFEAFFADPGAAGLRPAFRFFPDDGCDNNSCDIDACAKPLVGASPLTADPAPMDNQEALLETVLKTSSTTDNGGTPLYAALAGAEKWAGNFAKNAPMQKVIVVLMTDGDPNGCDEDVGDIAQLGADALAKHGVVTYAVGLLGSSQSTMDKIALEGGSKQAFMIGAGNAQADLLKAMKTIQGAAIACSFGMPKSNMPIDPNEVNVTYTNGANMMKDAIGHVNSKADCAGVTGGWYYDDPQNPTKITLCPDTCKMVQADDKAEVSIEVGCATTPAMPK